MIPVKGPLVPHQPPFVPENFEDDGFNDVMIRETAAMKKHGNTGKCLIQAWLFTGFVSGIFLSVTCSTADLPAIYFLILIIAMMAVWPFAGAVPLPHMQLMVPQGIPYRMRMLFFGVFLLSFWMIMQKNKKS
jgi:hypothetical protein